MSSMPINFSSQNLAVCRLIRTFAPTLSHSKFMRIKELDYLKGVMIILVITFHLVYFEHLYPYAKQVVYTFHMPVFL